MSEQKPYYGESDRVPNSIPAFENLPCARQYKDNYQPPTPSQVKALIDLSGLNRRQWSDLLGITYSDKHGSTTLRKWTMSTKSKDYRQIPYSTWRLMLIYAGAVNAQQDINHC